ncbi:hypothetical protein HCA81_07195 [Listeria booriae]|uniref:SdrD B-like domain-containing protein n=1 Tax=Listeria booriae TaxID=1552123 RepID=UPI001624A94E|nr:SdrD B-like domain-containing protein [Listeria booriae]MBC2020834.1 hypothetical protein [Listeria booriae]
MNKNKLVKKWGSGLLAGTLIIGSLAPIAHPYTVSAAENKVQQVAAAGQGSVTDTMFEDLNGNAKQDSGEQGVAGIKVELHNDQGALVATATTGTDGKYEFANLADGTYYLHVDLSTLPTDEKLYTTEGINGADGNSSYFTISGGNTVTGYHFGFYPQQGAIQSFVYNDSNKNGQKDGGETGINNVHIALYNESGTKVADATTDSNGAYSFSGVKPGKYYAKADIPNNYKYQSSTYFGSDGTTGYFSVASEQTVQNELNLGLTALNNSAVNGAVKDATTGAGIANTRVELHDVQGTLIQTAQTASDGTYSFTGLEQGNYYTKVVIPTGYNYASGNGYGSDGNSNYIALTGDNTASGYAINLQKQANATIAGVLNTPSGLGIDGQNVSLYTVDGTLVKTVATNSDGDFRFGSLPEGDYYVKAPIPDGYTFDSSYGFGSDGNSYYLHVDGNGNINNLRLTLAQKVGQIRSTVFGDLNKNGTQEVSESGIPGATVTLYSVSGAVVDTATTDANGLYKFENIAPNNYYVKVTPPAGYNVLANSAFGSDGVSGYIQVQSQQTITNLNASLVVQVNPAEVSTAQWIYNKDGSTPAVNNSSTLTIANNYYDSYNNPNINVQFYNKDGGVVQTTGFTATFSNPGLVTPIYSNSQLLAFSHSDKTGSTLVTVRDSKGNVVRTFTIVVTASDVKASDIVLGASNINTIIGGTGKVSATVQPTTTTNKTLSYTPADPSIITVDANGNWTAHKAGTTTIAVKTTDGSNITKTITVNVGESVVVKEENIPNYPDDVITEGKNIYIDTAFTNTFNSHDMNFREYDTAGNMLNSSNYVYTSSDTSVLAPKADQGDNWNRLLVVGAGTATITVKDKAGNTVRTFIVHVAQANTTVKAADLTLSASNITANVADTGKVSATVSPANTTNKALSYTSADPSIITVDANGNWTAKKAGTTTIAVKTLDGSNITKTINVTVADPNAVSNAKWVYHPGFTPDTDLANGGTISVPNTYKDGYGNGQVDVAFYNKAGGILLATDFTYTLSNPSLFTKVGPSGNLAVFTLDQSKTGSSLVTVKDASGNTVRTFTITVTGKSIADRMKSADLEIANSRHGASSWKAYIYPHNADVPAGVTYRLDAYSTVTGALGFSTQIGTSNGAYHQEIESGTSIGGWGQAGAYNFKLYATYQGVEYLVTEGINTGYIQPIGSQHVYTD